MTRSLRLLCGLALFAGTAAAQSPGALRPIEAPRLRVSLPGFPDPVALDTVPVFKEVKAPMDKVFAAADAALTELGIPIDLRDPLRGQIGAMAFTRSRQLGGRAMSGYLNCGTGMTGPNADNFRMNASVMVLLSALPNGNTRMGVTLIASGKDVAGGASKDPVMCGSSGNFEARVEDLIKKKIIY